MHSMASSNFQRPLISKTHVGESQAYHRPQLETQMFERGRDALVQNDLYLNRAWPLETFCKTNFSRTNFSIFSVLTRKG